MSCKPLFTIFSFMRVLFLGEIVGKAGYSVIRAHLNSLVEHHNIDFVIANANGATGGFGPGKRHSSALKESGVDVITLGEYCYQKKDLTTELHNLSWILRPANISSKSPGRGWGVFNTRAGPPGVISLLGQFGYNRLHGNNPFTQVIRIVEEIHEQTPAIVLNFHASTTAEKQTMAFLTDGLVTAMLGSGTRCLTAAAEISNEGTASITDTGRTGSRGSIYGMNSEIELCALLNKTPERSKDGWGDLRMQGGLLSIASDGKAVSMEAIDIPCKEISCE